MNRLRIYILVFFFALVVPLTYLVVHTYRSVAQEEVAEFRFFTQSLFERMDKAVLDFLQTEEVRGIDEYIDQDKIQDLTARTKDLSFILGYLQINPRGEVQTSFFKDSGLPDGLDKIARRLQGQFRSKDLALKKLQRELDALKKEDIIGRTKEDRKGGLYEKYFDAAKSKKLEVQAKENRKVARNVDGSQIQRFAEMENLLFESAAPTQSLGNALDKGINIEVGPLETLFINERQIFLFRRIFLTEALYHQGLVLDVGSYLKKLAGDFFVNQPISEFSSLDLAYTAASGRSELIQHGEEVADSLVTLSHTFPRPFSFVNARVECRDVPEKAGRSTLTLLVAVLGGVVILGLAVLYFGARSILELSRRRAGFVSSVTHELKTPLTNIRMYVEMLQQGIASTPEKEKHYLQIVSSECSRLTRLINNVLEFSKLEGKNRSLDIQEGDVGEVLSEAEQIMSEKIKSEGFSLDSKIKNPAIALFDKEALLQVLINLLENSLKFGRSSPQKTITLSTTRRGQWLVLKVSDSGPGIPEQELSRVFDEFHRVETGLTRKTKGAGIGLAIVRKLVMAMNGRTRAKNNNGPGCTIEISLPIPS